MTRTSDTYPQPKILLYDNSSEQNRLSNSYSNNNYIAPTLIHREESKIYDGYTSIFNKKKKVYKELSDKGIKINYGLLSFMMESVAKAEIEPILDVETNEPVVEDNKTAYVLSVIGCAVYLTSKQIATEYGCR